MVSLDDFALFISKFYNVFKFFIMVSNLYNGETERLLKRLHDFLTLLQWANKIAIYIAILFPRSEHTQ